MLTFSVITYYNFVVAHACLLVRSLVRSYKDELTILLSFNDRLRNCEIIKRFFAKGSNRLKMDEIRNYFAIR